MVLGLFFFWGASFAQTPSLSGTLEDVLIEGASSNQDLIRTFLIARPGIPVDQIDLEAERNLVYSLGYYSEVSVDLEDRGDGPTLRVRVKENPEIVEINFEGVTVTDPLRFKAILSEGHLLAPGNIFNTKEAQEAINTIQRVYRQNGFPFDVTVNLEAEPVESAAPPAEEQSEEEAAQEAEASEQSEEEAAQVANAQALRLSEANFVRLTYTVTEDTPIKAVEFEGATVLKEEELAEIFKPQLDEGTFNFQAYSIALNEVAERYEDLGYRNSGVDPQVTDLVDGRLKIRIKEWRITSLDTTAIGIDQSEFSLQPGDLYNYDVLLEDVRKLSRGRTSDIALDPIFLSSGDVRISFRSGPPGEAGEIKEIVLEGNTVIATEELLSLLKLTVGDTFTSALASEDFASIARRYRDQGYFIDTDPARNHFNYLDGTYVLRVTELKIANYQVQFEGDNARTKDFVITRYLPEVGSVLNENSLRDGLITVARLGVVQPVSFPFVPSDKPDEVIVTVNVREGQTRTFTPSAEYTTADGGRFTAAISYGDRNFLGRAHDFNVELNASTSDIGFLVGGSLNYNIPWLYIDELDFQDVPTSVSGSLFSTVATNQPLTQNGQVTTCLNPAQRADNSCADEERVFVGDYTQRDSGLGFSVGRRVFPNTTLRLSTRGTYTQYLLEPGVACERDENNALSNANECALTRDDALQYIPQSGLSALVSGSLAFDNRDNPDFPRYGLNAIGSLGVGFGTDFISSTGERSYIYTPLEFGVKSYLVFADLIPALEDTNHVLAFKVNAGHQFGAEYPENRYFRVGETLNEATLIRGYRRADFNPSQTYVTSSVEYRYDFGLSTAATQTVIAVAFADLGWASSVTGFSDYSAPLFAGGGVGVQVNLGFTALGFFPLRFDFGFSERHPGGVFSFRIGPVF